MPNLNQRLFETKGHRGCLACARGRNKQAVAKRLGRPFDFKEEADRQYARIMNDVSGLEEAS